MQHYGTRLAGSRASMNSGVISDIAAALQRSADNDIRGVSVADMNALDVIRLHERLRVSLWMENVDMLRAQIS